MKKKIVETFIVVMIVLSLTACGKDEKKSNVSGTDKVSIDTYEEITKEPTPNVEVTDSLEPTKTIESIPEPVLTEKPVISEEPNKEGSYNLISPAIEEGKKAQLSEGKYVGGCDIPSGTYILTSMKQEDDYGYVKVFSADDPEEEYPLLRTYVSRDEQQKCYVRMEENGILVLPFACELEAINYSQMKVGDQKQVGIGTYVGGIDIPAGKYVYEYKTENEYGYVKGYENTADVKELIKEYEHGTIINDFISREEEGKVYIPIYEGRTFVFPAGGTLTRLHDDLLEKGEVYRGNYVAGIDFSPGKYSVNVKTNKAEYGYIKVYTKAEVDAGKDEFSTYKYVSSEDEAQLHFSIEEGGVLSIPGCGRIKSDEILFGD